MNEMELYWDLWRANKTRDLEHFKYVELSLETKWYYLMIETSVPDINYKAVIWLFQNLRDKFDAERLLFNLTFRTGNGNRVFKMWQKQDDQIRDLTEEEIRDQETLWSLMLDRCEELGVDINQGGDYGRTAMMTAMSCHNLRAIAFLRRHGARIGHMTVHFAESIADLIHTSYYEYNRTRFHSSKEWEYLPKARDLMFEIIKEGADRDSLHSALKILVRNNIDETSKGLILLLVSFGADVMHQNKSGNTAIDIAKKNQRTKMAKFLKYAQKQGALQGLRNVLRLEKNLDLSRPLPFDVLMCIATKVGRLDEEAADQFGRKMYAKWRSTPANLEHNNTM